MFSGCALKSCSGRYIGIDSDPSRPVRADRVLLTPNEHWMVQLHREAKALSFHAVFPRGLAQCLSAHNDQRTVRCDAQLPGPYELFTPSLVSVKSDGSIELRLRSILGTHVACIPTAGGAVQLEQLGKDDVAQYITIVPDNTHEVFWDDVRQLLAR
jgi:hypothetical protein